MSKQLDELLTLLQLEQIERELFRGQSENLGLPQVYGGQVIGQSLSAAQQTVDPERHLHSFHSYFLLPGNPEKPIIYDVETLRDGRSFSTRRVKAIQNGRPIFYLTASYQADEQGFEHQATMPNVVGPEGLASESDLVESVAQYLPPKIVEMFGNKRPIEVRPVTVINPLKPTIAEPKQYLWIKTNGEMPDELSIHQYMLAYASDWGFLTTSLHPHGVTLFSPNMQVATIDHSMWFHRPFKVDEWLLYVIESPSASGSRGIVRGEIYNQQGQLVASADRKSVV